MFAALLALFTAPKTSWEPGNPFPSGATEIHNVPGEPSTSWVPPTGVALRVDTAYGIPVTPIVQIPLGTFAIGGSWDVLADNVRTTFSPTSRWDIFETEMEKTFTQWQKAYWGWKASRALGRSK
jgi:hypothetical protein